MLCETERGCPVGDVAPLPQAERIVDAYIRGKMLYKLTGLPDMQKQLFEAVGLMDDVDLLMEFEGVWLEFLQSESKKQQAKSKSKVGKKRGNRRSK